MELSDEQRAAVEHIGPALVVAGAGSGKTRTLTAKVAHLIERGYVPERILAITFTNKAADEMKRRLTDLTGLGMERFPWVRTYHSACFRILKEHCRLLGYEPPLQIYSDYQQQKLIKDIMIRFDMDRKKFYAVRSAISSAKNSGDPEGYIDAHPRIGPFRLFDIYQAYEVELKSRNAVDFDNILLKARDLLRDHEAVRTDYRAYFSYILVDEYQDTNNLQAELTRLLLGNGNLFCVGDDWQAIYGFRGSNVDHFLGFQRSYENASIFRLEQNYRSADEIVKPANWLIKYNRDRMDKSCFSAHKGGAVEVHEFFSDEEEAGWVADKIAMLNRSGIPYDQMAVLYRTKFCSLPFEQAMRFSGLPYKMLGDKGFFERKEILDINCYLTAAVFPKDDAAFERILNTPKRGIGPKMVEKINAWRAPDSGLSGAAARAVSGKILSGKVHKELSDLLGLLKDIEPMAPDAAIREVMDRTGYADYLKQQARTEDEFTARMENIEQLMYAAARFETVLDYLEEAALIREDKEDGQDREAGVNLATIHASKGLEFHVVFVVGCDENLLPHWKSRDSESEVQEERRLMYVAMTRAEKFLFLTTADFRKGQFSPVSRFVTEVAESLEQGPRQND
ncbi:MAG: ATP-dependent helicase [Desulfobacterales bacterium]|nr:ATP-dependent helicase [Desulfobacterales bacterium]MBS3756470.1 ATP-dependent helicase [Desulfobacterales bacterium]